MVNTSTYHFLKMKHSLPAFVALAAAVSQVTAHGFVPFIKINGVTIPGWNVNTGAFHLISVAPASIWNRG